MVASVATFEEKDDLEAGRRPSRASGDARDALVVKQMVGLFLDDKEIKVESGEMERSAWKAYERLGKRMIQSFGANTLVETIGPDDFQRLRKDLQKTHKRLESITTAIAKVKAIFHWAVNHQGYIDRLPRFGSSFKRPSKRDIDRERQESGERVSRSGTVGGRPGLSSAHASNIPASRSASWAVPIFGISMAHPWRQASV